MKYHVIVWNNDKWQNNNLTTICINKCLPKNASVGRHSMKHVSHMIREHTGTDCSTSVASTFDEACDKTTALAQDMFSGTPRHADSARQIRRVEKHLSCTHVARYERWTRRCLSTRVVSHRAQPVRYPAFGSCAKLHVKQSGIGQTASQPASQPASRTQAKARLRPAEERAPNSRRLTCRAQTVDVAASFSLDETRHVSCINVWETAFDKNHNRHISIALFQRPLLTALYEMFL
jgi:hypothetical protein